MEQDAVDPGCTGLMKAIIGQDIDCVKALVESGAELETRDKLGQNALYHAFPDIFTPDAYEILKFLIDKGININASLDGDGCSALLTAVVMDLPEVVQILVDNGVDVNEGSASKFWGTLTSDVTFQKKPGKTSYGTTEFIFSKGCRHSVTPLLASVMHQRQEIFDILLKSKASPACSSFGTFWRASMSSVCSSCDIEVTPLHMAAYMGNLENTFTLLSTKSDAEEHDNTNTNSSECHSMSYNDITPLWFALLQGHEKIVKLFLSLGKPTAMPCHFGSGLQVCLEEGHTAAALMILRAGYDLENDMEWIEEQRYPTANIEVIEKIENLARQPRLLLEWCATSLRQRFGVYLNKYLSAVEAPTKVFDILNFNDLSPVSWQPDLEHLLAKQESIVNV